MTTQLDMLAMLEADNRPPPPNVPWSLYAVQATTTGGYETAQRDWVTKHGRLGVLPYSHCWHPERQFRSPHPYLDQCAPTLMCADLRCSQVDHGWPKDGVRCQCVGALVYRTICNHCGWHSTITTDPKRAVGDGLSHASGVVP